MSPVRDFREDWPMMNIHGPLRVPVTKYLPQLTTNCSDDERFALCMSLFPECFVLSLVPSLESVPRCVSEIQNVLV